MADPRYHAAAFHMERNARIVAAVSGYGDPLNLGPLAEQMIRHLAEQSAERADNRRKGEHKTHTSRGYVVSDAFLEEVRGVLAGGVRLTAREIATRTGKSIDYVRDQLTALARTGELERFERPKSGYVYLLPEQVAA